MTLELLISLIAVVFVIAVMIRLYDRRKRGLAKSDPVSEDESLVDLNEKFLRLSSDPHGTLRPQTKLLRSFAPADTALLRSMLDAEGIPSYCDANSLGSLYAGVALAGISDELILVFTEDAESAREIASAFIQDLLSGPGTARTLPELIE